MYALFCCKVFRGGMSTLDSFDDFKVGLLFNVFIADVFTFFSIFACFLFGRETIVH